MEFLLAFIVIAATVIVVDQLSKLYIDANFQLASVHPSAGGAAPTNVIGDFVRIAKSYNTGGIFGLFLAVMGIDLLAMWFGVDSRNLDPYRRERWPLGG